MAGNGLERRMIPGVELSREERRRGRLGRQDGAGRAGTGVEWGRSQCEGAESKPGLWFSLCFCS
jgi:hypothetical protein